MELIRKTFEAHCGELVVDAKLAKRIAQYQASFRTKNEDHIRFFGGKLLGVDVVRFMPADRDVWFEEIIHGDDAELTEDLHNLPSINKDWFVSSDAMNLSCVWLMHQIQTSKLPDKEKHEALVQVGLVLQFKYLTSLIQHFFRYPADRAVAEATYASLSNKFLIKKYDSWYALLRALSERLAKRDGLHWRVILKMDDDAEVVNMVNDIQGRIRSLVKNIYAEFMLVHKQGIRIVTTSAVVSFDGEEILKDRTKGLQNYVRYIQSVVGDEASFIRQELVSVIEKIMPSMNPRLFEQTLKWISQHYQHTNLGVIDSLLNDTLVHSFGYLSHHTTLVRNAHDLPAILSSLRGTYMSSRNTDPALLGLREQAEKIVRLATNNKNSNTLAALRTGLLLYICLRTYTSNYYAQATAT